MLTCRRLVIQEKELIASSRWSNTDVSDQVKEIVTEAIRTAIHCRGLVIETTKRFELSYGAEIKLLFSGLEDHLGYLREEQLKDALDTIESIVITIKKLQGHLGYIEELVPSASATIALEQKKRELELFRNENEQLKHRIELLTDSLIGELWLVELLDIATKHLEISEPWFRCVTALNLLEASIKKKLENLGEPAEVKNENFEKRYDRLLNALGRAGVANADLNELRGLTVPMLWEARHKIDHEGHKYRPTPKEAKEIIDAVSALIQKLFSF